MNKPGTSWADILNGTEQDDVFRGDSGNDILYGYDGNDVFLVYAGDGFDYVNGGSGYDQIAAMQNGIYIGLSRIAPSDSVELISGNGNSGVSIKCSPNGGSLDLSSTTLNGIVSIEGSANGDVIIGSPGSDTINLLDGDDFSSDSRGTDIIDGGSGRDAFNIGIGNGSVYQAQQTNPGVWTLTNVGAGGLASYSVALNQDGTRSVSGSDGRLSTLRNFEVVGFTGGAFGSDSDDSIGGGTRAELFVGLLGNDTIHGGDGADQLLGGGGDDSLFGDAGDDLFIGGAGANTLYGGDGNDTFAHYTTDGNNIVVEAANAVGSDQDVIYFADALLSSLSFYQNGSDLVIGTGSDISDLVTVKDYFAADPAAKSGVEYLQDSANNAYYLPTLFG